MDTLNIDFLGIYSRLNFLQGTNLKKIRKWYNFGGIKMIYMINGSFDKIMELPKLIQE